MVAGRPAPMQEWKKEGATETPNASDVIPETGTPGTVDAAACAADDDDTARNVPNSNTNNCCVHLGNSPIILSIREKYVMSWGHV